VRLSAFNGNVKIVGNFNKRYLIPFPPQAAPYGLQDTAPILIILSEDTNKGIVGLV